MWCSRRRLVSAVRADRRDQLADNAPNSPQKIALTGSVTQAGISITPASINFGGQLAGTSGQPQTITVTNTGTGALSFSSIAVSGAADFVVGANTCKGANVSAGGTCTVQVTFGPACTNGSAARSATLVLTDNVTGSPQSVALSGSATGDFCFDPSTTVSVAAGQTAVYSMVVDSPTAYKGSVSLTCAGAPATATCTSPASVTVPSQFTVSVATVASSVAAPVRRRNRRIPGPTAWMVGDNGASDIRLWRRVAGREGNRRASAVGKMRPGCNRVARV